MASNLRMTDNTSSLIDANDVLSSTYPEIQGKYFCLSIQVTLYVFCSLRPSIERVTSNDICSITVNMERALFKMHFKND